MKGTLSSPDTELIVPLQLVAEHSVPRLTRCSGPADPGGELTATPGGWRLYSVVTLASETAAS